MEPCVKVLGADYELANALEGARGPLGHNLWEAARRLLDVDPAFSMMGASLVACILGNLLIIATASNYLSIPYLYFALAGLTAAYLRLSETVVPSSQSLDSSNSPSGVHAWSRADARDSGHLASQ